MNYKKYLMIFDKRLLNDPRTAGVKKKYEVLDRFRTACSAVVKIYGFVLWLLSVFISVQVSGVSSAIATGLIVGLAQIYWALRLSLVSVASDKLHPFFIKAYPAATLVLMILFSIYLLVTSLYLSRILGAVMDTQENSHAD